MANDEELTDVEITRSQWTPDQLERRSEQGQGDTPEAEIDKATGGDFLDGFVPSSDSIKASPLEVNPGV